MFKINCLKPINCCCFPKNNINILGVMLAIQVFIPLVFLHLFFLCFRFCQELSLKSYFQTKKKPKPEPKKNSPRSFEIPWHRFKKQSKKTTTLSPHEKTSYSTKKGMWNYFIPFCRLPPHHPVLFAANRTGFKGQPQNQKPQKNNYNYYSLNKC